MIDHWTTLRNGVMRKHKQNHTKLPCLYEMFLMENMMWKTCSRNKRPIKLLTFYWTTLYYHKSYLSWIFLCNFSSSSQGMKMFFSIFTIFTNFSDYLTISFFKKKLMTSAYNRCYQWFFMFNLLQTGSWAILLDYIDIRLVLLEIWTR